MVLPGRASSRAGKGDAGERALSSRRVPPTLALAGVALLASWMAVDQGGYFTRTWAPAAVLLAVLLAALSAVGYFRRVSLRPALPALGLFAAYAGWSFATMLWSPNRQAAWEGSAQTLSYLVVFWCAVALVSLGASRRWVLFAVVAGASAVAAITLVALAAPGAGELFRGGRFEGSVGYFNGEAAFLLVPLWAGVYLVGSPRMSAPVRALVLAGCVLCADVALLSQSRGALVSFAVSLVVFFALSGRRLRGAIALFPVAVSLGVAFPALNRVYLAGSGGGDLPGALGAALPYAWAGAVFAGLFGLVWGLVDARWRPPERAVRLTGAAALVAALLVVLGALVLAQERSGGLVHLAEAKWQAFKTNDTSGQGQSRYLSASGSGRYTLWKVAAEDFVRHPLKGVGTGNYQATYYRLRDADTGHVRQPHSLPLEILAERGVVGGVLFGGFLAVCLGAGLRRRFGSLDAEGKGLVGALVAGVALWFVYSSSDWFWQLPAVTLPAMVYLGMLAAPWRRGHASGEVPQRLALRLAGAGVAVVALAAAGPLWAASALSARAADAPTPAKALSGLRLAREVDPVSPDLAVQAASFASDAGEYRLAARYYRQAIALDPEDYAPYMFLATYHERRGEWKAAARYYREALARNPLDARLKAAVEKSKNWPGGH
ncbi:O-antigen ligase family protein [Rubrobacter naiadicus]|uniref:O-antigen ligase family protein n=1 Tax=Rubrobacter naiadicus TaxID=1392641 RepID=UPI0023620BF6|nr:O-antigen ligase family protein [Rubrobacter naiadicus]